MLLRRHGQFWGSDQAQLDLHGSQVRAMCASTPPEEVHRHMHSTAHFVFVANGGYLSTAAGAPEVSRLPLLVFNPAGTEHRDRFLAAGGHFLAVSLDEAASAALGEGQARVLPRPFALHLARRLTAALAGGETAAAAEGLFLALLSAAEPDSPPPSGPPPWLGEAFEMLWLGDEVRGVAQVAHEVGVHPVHLARVFGEWLGCAPGEVLRGRRLERAAVVLGETRARLADVAIDLGFADQAHLTRAFRKGFGITPARYRRHVAQVQDEPAPRS